MVPRERIAAGVARAFVKFGADGRFTPLVGDVVELMVLPAREDIVALGDIFAPTQQTGRVFALQVDDVPTRPQRGDVVEILEADFVEAGSYTVTEEAMSPAADTMTIVWNCRVSDPAQN